MNGVSESIARKGQGRERGLSKDGWRRCLGGVILATGLLCGGVDAWSAEINLLSPGAVGNDGVTGGALFSQGSPAYSSATGLVTLSGGNVTSGYNSGIELSQLPVRQVDGVSYAYFGLDVNQSGNKAGAYLSLDTVEIWVSPTSGNTGYESGGLGTKIYDLDDPNLDGNLEDNVVLLNYNLVGGGASSIDVEFLFPTSLLDGYALNNYLYLYSQFGAYTGSVVDGTNTVTTWTNSGGGEAWMVDSGAATFYAGPEPGPIPEPGSLLALFAGAALLANRSRRKST